VQAAARHFWHKSARSLDSRDAALLAAVLPNPHLLRVDRPSRYVIARREWILGQMRDLGGAQYLRALEHERRSSH
jgi:monofunctional biosynthetic peptidoglycan transglycosylase